MKTHDRRFARLLGPLALLLGPASAGAWGQGAGPSAKPVPVRPRLESIARPDGQATYGRLAGDAAGGFRFEPMGGEPAVSLEVAGVVTIEATPTEPASSFPPMRVLLGLDQQVSGRLGAVVEDAIRLEDGPGGRPLSVVRSGATALAQRPGEALVLQDGFETLDPARWSHVGEPEVVADPHLAGSRSLALPAGGSAVTCRLAEPVPSGRLEVAFHVPDRAAPGQQWFVDLLFRGPSGQESVQVILDLGEESLAVQSNGGPALAVQRLARKPGWHRLGVRFGPERSEPRIELALDRDQLAHGRGPGGPLIEIRLAHSSAGAAPPPAGLVVAFDDLRLVRLAEPIGGLEVTPRLDDVRLVDGDQLFGKLKGADADSASLVLDGHDVALPWTEVASVQFRRDPDQARPIAGLLARVEWNPGPGDDPRDADQVEGALLGLTEATLTLATPYCGDLAIPRDRLRRIRALGRGTRIVVDPSAHHLGNNASQAPLLLDPPLPEGGTLERSFTLDRIPEGAAAIVLDVVQVVGESNDPTFSELVRKGELRSNLKVNGQAVDYLNRHITTNNKSPERIRLPIPAGLLKVGPNTLRIDQVEEKARPGELDDLGILCIAVEFDDGAGAGRP